MKIEIPVSYVEYMSTTTKKNMFHMNFKENDITFDLSNILMMIHTKESTERFKNYFQKM